MSNNLILTEQDLRLILEALEQYVIGESNGERVRRTRSKIALHLNLIGKHEGGNK